MATFKASKPPAPIEISRYLGINEAVGETEIALGESTAQVNFRITQNFKPQKRMGHKTFWTFPTTTNVQGMWNGVIGTATFIACQGGHVWRDKSINTTVYDALDVATYTNVDVVKTTALAGSEAGSVAVDNLVILKNSAGTQLTEVALADVDNVASVGKFYFDADEKINYIVAKGAYADIAAARVGLGTTTALYSIGTITDAKTSIFYFDSKLYFINGTDYKEYNGTTYQDVDPYIPTVAIVTPPAGGGTPFESINLLTGKKKQEFFVDGTSTRLVIAEEEVDSVDSVEIDEATYALDTNFKADIVAGVVDTFPVGTHLGDSTTEYTVSNTAGTTFRYTWTTVGTDPIPNTVLAVNDCVQIQGANFATGNKGIFKVTAKGVNYFEVVNAAGVKETAKKLGTGYIRTTLGDATTQVDITNPTGSTYRYTYNLTGTSPLFGAKLAIGDWVWINAQNFSNANNGKFQVTAKDTNYFDVTNVNGIAETNKTLGTGWINKASTTGEPIGLVADEETVIVEWTLKESGNADLVKKNKYVMLNGPGNDTAVFLWGNPDAKNRRSWSGTLKANYFPVTNYTLVGSDEFAITDIVPQYSRQIIFKQDRTHYSYSEWNSTADAWDYPVKDLNEKVGNEAYNAVQIIKNNPVSIHGQSWWEWVSTSVEDERNANVISERLRESLSALDLTTAVTFDYQREKEYWCNIGTMVYIWNYGNNTMYAYDNVSGTCFLDIDGYVYYGSQGTIERFEGENDNGVEVTAQLILGFEDWNAMELRKNTREVYAAILPDSHTSLNVYYRTNRVNEFKAISKLIEYHFLDFDNINFANLSFLTNRNPQTFRRKVRAKKYTYIQFMLENKELGETCTVLNFKIQAETQGISK